MNTTAATSRIAAAEIAIGDVIRASGFADFRTVTDIRRQDLGDTHLVTVAYSGGFTSRMRAEVIVDVRTITALIG